MQGPEFEFPTQPFRPPAHEYAVPPAAVPGSAVNAQPGPSQDSAEHAPPSGPRVPAYQQGPSHAREVDDLAEPQVLQEETVLVRTTNSEPWIACMRWTCPEQCSRQLASLRCAARLLQSLLMSDIYRGPEATCD